MQIKTTMPEHWGAGGVNEEGHGCRRLLRSSARERLPLRTMVIFCKKKKKKNYNAIIKKPTNKFSRRCGENRTLMPCWYGM